VLLNPGDAPVSGACAGPLLSADGISVAVDDRAILSAATCEVRRGERVGILGPNGAGKSTLLHAVVGLMPVSSGTITIGGHPHHTPAAKNVFGWVPDDLPMADSLTGSEVSRLHQRLRGGGFDRALCDELMVVLGLDAHQHRPCGDYSHGMRRKLSLAMALSHRPRLLVLDEPFRGLDPLTSALLRRLLELHAEAGRSVLLATHDLDQAAQLCDRVLLLDSGRVLASGTPRQLCSDHAADTLQEAFLVETGQQLLLDTASERLASLLESPDRVRAANTP
jgi:ABC-2 type transport system ATP-binding protein